MKCILKIGYQRILLPDTKGIEKIVDALSKGVGCGYFSTYDKTLQIEEILEIGFELVPDSVVITAKDEVADSLARTKSKVKPTLKVLPNRLRLEHK